jgi:hypothetical protein
MRSASQTASHAFGLITRSRGCIGEPPKARRGAAESTAPVLELVRVPFGGNCLDRRLEGGGEGRRPTMDLARESSGGAGAGDGPRNAVQLLDPSVDQCAVDE